MKTFLLIFFLFSTAGCAGPKTVYICNSKNARKYHYTADCRGLSDCQYRIVKTTLKSAVSKNKTLCDWERDSSGTASRGR
ncbi:5-bromo-4-chloroindolyl phosphate hydrolysis protein [Chitinophaga sp. OAE865]